MGLATVDLAHRVDRIPGVDEKAQATGVEVAAGGPATNAAVTAAALGAEVTLVTAVGAHPLGSLIRADLAAHGVELIDAAPDDPAPPPVSAITVLASTGQRTIVSRNAGDMLVELPSLPTADLRPSAPAGPPAASRTGPDPPGPRPRPAAPSRTAAPPSPAAPDLPPTARAPTAAR